MDLYNNNEIRKNIIKRDWMKKHVNKGLFNLGIDHVFKMILMFSMVI